MRAKILVLLTSFTGWLKQHMAQMELRLRIQKFLVADWPRQLRPTLPACRLATEHPHLRRVRTCGGGTHDAWEIPALLSAHTARIAWQFEEIPATDLHGYHAPGS